LVTVSSRVASRTTVKFCPLTGGSGVMVTELIFKWSVAVPQLVQISAAARATKAKRNTKAMRDIVYV